jgi:hypothetical protein
MDPLPPAEVPIEKPLPRKPLPESAKSSLELSRHANRSAVPKPGLPKRKPVSGFVESSQADSQPPISNVRPLGPRTQLSETSSEGKLTAVAQDRLLLASEDSVQIPKSSCESIRPEHAVQDIKSFSMTLIRRDPSSGAQWNVGTVDGHSLHESTATRRPKKPFFDMSIHLMTPGYNQFQTRQPSPEGKTDGTLLSDKPNVARRANMPSTHSYFERKVRMGGQSNDGRSALHHRRALSDFPSKISSSRGSYEGSPLAPSEAAIGGDSAGSFPSQSHASGYMFVSPWGGHCQLYTGIGGRSLKCKHHLPAPISAGGSSTSAATVSELRFNLPSSGVFTSSSSPERNKNNKLDPRRFNVPKLDSIRDKLSSHKSRPKLPPRPDPTSYAAMYPSDEEVAPSLPPRPGMPLDQRNSMDSRRLPVTHDQPVASQSASSPSEDEDEDEDDRHRLDLSMGREKAGGGNRGKRAKLGKLIIHDEGLKMLDLVVAANMCVWWSVWEGI